MNDHKLFGIVSAVNEDGTVEILRGKGVGGSSYATKMRLRPGAVLQPGNPATSEHVEPISAPSLSERIDEILVAAGRTYEAFELGVAGVDVTRTVALRREGVAKVLEAMLAELIDEMTEIEGSLCLDCACGNAYIEPLERLRLGLTS